MIILWKLLLNSDDVIVVYSLSSAVVFLFLLVCLRNTYWEGLWRGFLYLFLKYLFREQKCENPVLYRNVLGNPAEIAGQLRNSPFASCWQARASVSFHSFFFLCVCIFLSLKESGKVWSAVSSHLHTYSCSSSSPDARANLKLPQPCNLHLKGFSSFILFLF